LGGEKEGFSRARWKGDEDVGIRMSGGGGKKETARNLEKVRQLSRTTVGEKIHMN